MLLPIAALLTITCIGGAVLTFAPAMLQNTGSIVAALLALTGLGALGRWLIGGFADRWGAHRFIAPLLGVAALGALAVAWALFISPDGMAPLLIGAALLGLAYGGLQNVTLVDAFAAAGARGRDAVSVVWNAGFDVGTGLGATLVGVLATASSFSKSFVVLAAVAAAVAVAVAVLGRNLIR